MLLRAARQRDCKQPTFFVLRDLCTLCHQAILSTDLRLKDQKGLTEANRRNLFAGRPVYVGLYFHFLLRLMCVVVLNARLDLRDCLVDKLQRRLPVAALVVHS
jgi:hypothetical protein